MKIVKVFVVAAILVSVVSCVHINKRQTNNIESLLEQLENANKNINANNENKEPETPVRTALQQLLKSFQQMASAYVGVLTSLGRSIGLPGIQYLDSPIGNKQVEQNFQQIQEAVQEMTKSIDTLFTRDGPQNANVLRTQFMRFIDLWQKQFQEVTGQVSKALGGLEARDDDRSPPASAIIIPMPILDWFQQFTRIVGNTFTEMTSRFARLIGGYSPGSPLLARQDTEQQQTIVLTEIQEIFEAFQKQMTSMTQRLSELQTGQL